jgi:hypothetical protein
MASGLMLFSTAECSMCASIAGWLRRADRSPCDCTVVAVTRYLRLVPPHLGATRGSSLHTHPLEPTKHGRAA